MPGSSNLKAQHKVLYQNDESKSVTFCLKLKAKQKKQISPKLLGGG